MRQCRKVLETPRDDLQTALEDCSLTALCSHADGSTESFPDLPLVFRKDRLHRRTQNCIKNTELSKTPYSNLWPFVQVTRGNIYTSQVIPIISSVLLLVSARRTYGGFPLGTKRQPSDRRYHLCSKLCWSL